MFTPTLSALCAKKGQSIPGTPFSTDSNTPSAKDKHGNTTNGTMSQIRINTYGKLFENQDDQQIVSKRMAIVAARTLKLCYSTLGKTHLFWCQPFSSSKGQKNGEQMNQTATGILSGMSCGLMWTCCIPPSMNLQPSPSTECQHTTDSYPPHPSLINCTFCSMPSIESFRFYQTC